MNQSPSFRVSVAFVVCVLLGATGSVASASIAVDSTYFSGSRTTPDMSGAGGGLVWNPAGGSWSSGNFEISWLITDNGSDYTYKYTVDTTGGMNLSHWILQLSSTDVNGQSLTDHWTSIFEDMTAGDYSSMGIDDSMNDVPTNPTAGNAGIPAGGIPYGVRFTRGDEVSITMVTFTTPEVPVWGDFYAQDGGGQGVNSVYAYNAGFGIMPTAADAATDFLNWIPRPDGVDRPLNGHNVIPEPLSYVVWSLLIGCAGFFSRRSATAVAP